MPYDVFVSYRWVEPDQTWVRTQLVKALERAGLKVCLDVRDFRPNYSVTEEISRCIEESRCGLCVLSPDYVASDRTRQEAHGLFGKDPAGLKGLLTVLILRPVEVPLWLAELSRVDLASGSDLRQRWRSLLAVLNAPKPAAHPPALPAVGGGIVEREQVFGRAARLPEQEFAIELLTQPLRLRRNRGGGTTVTVDRSGIRRALYTTAGKRQLSREVFSDAGRIEAARALERRLHAFFLGRSEEREIALPLAEWPLRWASGGVFSVVRWRGRSWTPFFFRDIPPYGWNLSLGASDLSDDLNDPWTFMMREFLEETLVLDAPPAPGRPLRCKNFVFDRSDIAAEAERATDVAFAHLQARRRSDGLEMRPRDPTLLPSRIAVALSPTADAIEIGYGRTAAPCPNVLVAINLLELGIEVVAVARYALEDDDYLLDGELRDLTTRCELVRMPVAMIAHDYLTTAFADELRLVGGLEPSVEGPPIPPDCLHIFPFDARRRWEIAMGRDALASPWELERYGRWFKEFGDRFFEPGGAVTNRRASTWFTPTSAKIVSYFFAGHGN